jgi:hypothetical protein
MPSPQALSEADRRLVAAWAADCAAHVLPIFEAAAPGDGRVAALVDRARRFARGELGTADGIRERFAGGVPAGEVGPAAAAVARAAGQAAATCHMGAHALGAAGYAACAAGLARPGGEDDELRWQVSHASEPVRAALRSLPPLGEDRSGPLGPGLLASGAVGQAIRKLQALLAEDGPGRVRKGSGRS